jgi:hypothetical protein
VTRERASSTPGKKTSSSSEEVEVLKVEVAVGAYHLAWGEKEG